MPLKAEVGQTTRCALTAEDGGRIGYTIEVTSYDNGRAQMNIQVDETPSRPHRGMPGHEYKGFGGAGAGSVHLPDG